MQVKVFPIRVWTRKLKTFFAEFYQHIARKLSKKCNFLFEFL